MITDSEAAIAIAARIASTPGAPAIVWQNQPAELDAPYWSVAEVKTPPERLTLKGSSLLRGRFVVSIITPQNERTAPSEVFSEALIAHFPIDLALTTTNGRIRISHRTYADDGALDGAFWRVNVHIRWISAHG